MKKTIKSLLAIAVAAFALVACSDVPAPYDFPSDKPKDQHQYTGDGSVSNPYTTADAIALVKSLDGNETEQAFCVKGKVVAVTEEFTTNYGNGTFTISDDGSPSNVFTCYRVLYLGNKKYTASDPQIKVGDDVVVYGKMINYRGNTPETVQGSAFLYELNGVNRGGIDGGGGGGSTVDPKGTGTQADPYNVSAVLKYISTLGADVTSPSEVYVKGKIKAITEEFSTNFGNATFTMADDGADAIFTAYRILYLGNQKYATGDEQIKLGDEVIVCGKVVNYRGNTPETAQNSAYLYSLNGKTAGGGGGEVTPGTPSGSGTQADPFNVAAAVKKCNELGADVASTEQYYIKGIANADYEVGSYKNIEVDIVDQAGSAEKFKVFRVKRADGQGIKQGYKINKGDLIIVYGPVINYKGNTPETATGAYIVSVNGLEPTADDGQSGGGESGGGGEATDLTNGGFEEWSEGAPTGWTSKASSATIEKSTNARSGSASVLVKGDAGYNKRLASQELALKAGTYVFSYYAKATTEDVAQARAGWVPYKDGAPVSSSYKYGDFTNINTTGWTLVSIEFTLNEDTTVSVIGMNPKATAGKTSGKDILVDDATLTKK